MKATNKSIVGHWFHSFRDGRCCWQGQIVGTHGKSHLIVELYEWVAGSSNGRKVVPLADAEGWTLYRTAGEMNSAYDKMPQNRTDFVGGIDEQE